MFPHDFSTRETNLNLIINPSAPFFIMAACSARRRESIDGNRVTYMEQICIVSSWDYARAAFSSADLQLIKLLLRAVKWANQQPPKPNASNNARSVLHCLMHTWTDIDGDFAHAQHLVLYLAPINPTVTLETCTFFNGFFHLSMFAER